MPIPAAASAPVQSSTRPVLFQTAETPSVAGLDTAEQFVPNASVDDGAYHLVPQDGPFKIRGWLDAGYIYNTSDPKPKFNGPYNSVDRSDELMFNQAYLVIERLMPTDGSNGIGGRLDLLYGYDYLLAQSKGIERNRDGSSNWNGNQYYGFAIPQAYAEVGSQTLSAKIGKWYSIVGYEGLTADSSFFYSKAYSYQFAGPFTHTGVLGAWKPSDNWLIQAGVHTGWDTFDTTENHVSFIGGIKYTNCDKTFWSSFAITTGEEDSNQAGLPNTGNGGFANRTRYSFIIDVLPTEKIEYTFHHWLGFQEDGKPGGGTAMWYGIDQYLTYKLSDKLKAGLRFEWFDDVDGTRVGLDRPANPNVPPLPGNYYSITTGLNWSPMSNLTVRPELRYDFHTGSNGGPLPYDNGKKDDQFMLGIDAVLKF